MQYSLILHSLKYLVIILFIAIVGIQTFSKWLIVLNYEINKEYIAKNLCVNRENPMSHCKGKCYLKKKFVAEEGQQPAGKTSYQNDIQQDFLLDSTRSYNFYYLLAGVVHSSRYIIGASQQFIDSRFQPPQNESIFVLS